MEKMNLAARGLTPTRLSLPYTTRNSLATDPRLTAYLPTTVHIDGQSACRSLALGNIDAEPRGRVGHFVKVPGLELSAIARALLSWGLFFPQCSPVAHGCRRW
jgi:hypothetical protein